MKEELEKYIYGVKKKHPEIAKDIEQRIEAFPHMRGKYLRLLKGQWSQDGGDFTNLPVFDDYDEGFPFSKKHYEGHVFLGATTGAGKSVATYRNVCDLIEDGVHIILPDFQREYRSLGLQYPDKVTVLTPGQIRINLLERYENESPEDVAIRFTRNEREAGFIRDVSENLLFQDIVNAINKHGEVTLYHLLKEPHLREHNPRGRNSLGRETVDNRLTRKIIECPETFRCLKGFPLEFFRNNSIVLDMTGVSAYLTIFLVNHIIQLLMKFKDPSDRVTTALILEESQIFLSRQREVRYDLGEILIYSAMRMGRKLGLSFYLISQTISNFSAAVLGNVNTMIVGRILNGA